MTTTQIITEAKARGFRFVGTAAGRIPLSEFDPYGNVSNPAQDICEWSWYSWRQANDCGRETLLSKAGLAGGRWTFYVTDADFY